ncbi:MAG: formylglycine-generating enzyme family protein, partial [Planctomycetota bacterium]
MPRPAIPLTGLKLFAVVSCLLWLGCQGGGKESLLEEALSVRGSGNRVEALESFLREYPKASRATEALERTRKFRAFLSEKDEGLLEVLDISASGKDRHGNPVVLRDGAKDDPDTGWPYEIWFLCPNGKTPVPPIEFVRAPKGYFLMGGGGFFEAGPKHVVDFHRPFYIGKYPLTQDQWEAIAGDNPSYFKTSGPTAPVDRISWDDSLEFIEKLNARIFGGGKSGGGGPGPVSFRMPSEAEWEYACRAGSETKYYGGDDESDLLVVGWFCENSKTKT